MPKLSYNPKRITGINPRQRWGGAHTKIIEPNPMEFLEIQQNIPRQNEDFSFTFPSLPEGTHVSLVSSESVQEELEPKRRLNSKKIDLAQKESLLSSLSDCFDFGKNWTIFLKAVCQAMVETVETEIKNMQEKVSKQFGVPLNVIQVVWDQRSVILEEEGQKKLG
jgi:hypothetical protein